MEALKKNKVLLSILGAAILVAGYFLFFSGGSSTPTVPDASSGSAVGGNIVTMLNTIRAVSIDTTVFTSTAWTSLRDLSAPIPTNTPGRTDLFGSLSAASVQGNVQGSVQSNVTTQTPTITTGASKGSQ